VLGAVVIVGPEVVTVPSVASTVPLACVEILGQSVLWRIVDDLQKTGAVAVTILVDLSLAAVRDVIDETNSVSPLIWVSDAWNAAKEVLVDYQASGVKTAFVVRASSYSDLNAIEFLEFHKETGFLVTRAIHENAALDYWIVETDRFSGRDDIRIALVSEEVAQYRIGGYLNRLVHLRDLRQLAVDGLTSRCRFRPAGFEVRPGVWMEETADVHRKARIVAPAFIGRGVRIEEQCLITRGSNVECNSQIDYATVVENSSILSNSYVGIGLDVIHSIVDGEMLLNLKRNVTLKIADHGLVRRLGTRKSLNSQSTIFGLQQTTPDAKGAALAVK
jgi:NDP-sugar pyrophosphorylase family protein